MKTSNPTRILLFVLLSLLKLPAYGQLDGWRFLSLKLPALIPYRSGTLWGYADSTGTIKVEPKFSYVEPFGTEHIAVVGNSDGFGFINEEGHELLKPGFSWINPFISGLAIVFDKHSEKGVYNKNGKQIVPVIYKDVEIVNLPGSQIPVIKVSIRQTLKIVKDPFNPSNDYIEYKTLYGLFNAEGKQLLPVTYDDISWVGEGLIKASKEGKTTTINSAGEIIFPPGPYIPIRASEGLLLLYTEQQEAIYQTIRKCGYSDLEGKIVIPLQYEYASTFSEGLAAVYQKGKWGYINKKGKMVLTPEFDQAGSFRQGFATVRKDMMWTVIDSNGIERTEPFSEDVYLNSHRYILKLVTGDSTYALKKPSDTGKIKIPTKENPLREFHEGLATAFNDQKEMGYVNRAGKIVIPMAYDEAYPFFKGLAVVRKNGYYGVIDKAGNTIVPMAFTQIIILGEDLFWIAIPVSPSNYVLRGIINRQGEEIIPAKYSDMQVFKNGLAVVRTTSSIAVVDLQGREIMPPLNPPRGYRFRGDLRNGLFQISKDDYGKEKAYMDRYGRIYLNE